MAGLQKKPSTNWAISASASLGGGKGKVGAGIVALTLFDVQAQLYIPLTLYGGSLGMGIPGVTASTFAPTFFTTSKPLWASDFDGRATLAGADLTIGVGGSVSYVTFWNVDHNSYWLDVGGLQVGIAGGISAGLYYASTYINDARQNNGCLVSSAGDPLCGGSSSAPANSSNDPGKSQYR